MGCTASVEDSNRRAESRSGRVPNSPILTLPPVLSVTMVSQPDETFVETFEPVSPGFQDFAWSPKNSNKPPPSLEASHKLDASHRLRSSVISPSVASIMSFRHPLSIEDVHLNRKSGHKSTACFLEGSVRSDISEIILC